MKLNQFAIYQLKMDAETRKLCFRTYQNLLDEKIEVRIENYDQVYLAAALPGDCAEKIWERLRDRPPRKFKGHHAISVSDVLVYNKEGVVTAYYIDKERLIVLSGFIRLNSSSALISMETDDFKVKGTKGNWIAADETIVDGRQFFLLQNDIYKDDVPYVVVSEDGKVVTDDSRGFDEATIQTIRDFLHPPEKSLPVPEKPQMEQWQKYFENGEYLRSAEMSEEQNYNMIDGRMNNISSKKQSKQTGKVRTSVLNKLHQKQREIAVRSGKQQPEQVMGADMERNRK